MADARGMYVIEGSRPKDAASLVWVSPEGLYQTTLKAQPAS